MESPEALVREIYDQHRLSEPQIVARLAGLGIETSQPTINRLRRGTAKGTKFELAEGLERLRDQLRLGAPTGAATPPSDQDGASA